jgi:hypothetical protein
MKPMPITMPGNENDRYVSDSSRPAARAHPDDRVGDEQHRQGACTTSASSLPAPASVATVETNLVLAMRVYSSLTPVAAPNPFTMGAIAVMLA